MHNTQHRTLWRYGLLVTAAFGALTTLSCTGPNEEEYVLKNERLAHEIPTYPGATFYDSRNDPYTADDESQIEGFQTMLLYTLPNAPTGQDLADFFTTVLPGDWAYCASTISYTRETKFVSVGPITEAGFENLLSPGYVVFVDHAGADTHFCPDDPSPSNSD